MPKKNIRIGFRHFWPNFKPQESFFIKFLTPHYDITISEDSPDFVFFSVFPENDVKLSLLDKVRAKIRPARYQIPRLKGDFVKIFYTAENVVPDMSKCDWAFSFCYEEKIKNPRHYRLPNYVTSSPNIDLIKNIDPKEVLRSKTRFCNFIYSNKVEYRNEFFEKLSCYKKVDAPGRCMNNMPPIGQHQDPIKSRFSSDWQSAKIEFLKDYKFTIAFENESSPGYTTEKITQPMAANSIPIYYGSDTVSRDFNHKSFLAISDLDRVDELIDKVIELDRNDEKYIAMMQEPWFYGNKPNEAMDKEILLQRFSEIFNT